MTTLLPVTTRDNARPRSWPDRLNELRKKFPSTDQDRQRVADALADYDLLGRVMRDLLRIGYEPPRRGQRSSLQWDDGQARLRSLAAERSGQATTQPFAAAFNDLVGSSTLGVIAERTGISRSQVHRLLRDQITPTPDEMSVIAALFDKPPTYFLEYRIHLICVTVADQLTARPERTIDVLVRLGVHPENIDA